MNWMFNVTIKRVRSVTLDNISVVHTSYLLMIRREICPIRLLTPGIFLTNNPHGDQNPVDISSSSVSIKLSRYPVYSD